jgi:HK97 family phage portal protein
MDMEANKAGVAMYANGGAKGVLIPGLVGTSHANYTNEQATAIKDTVNRTVNSSEVKGAVGVFQSRWDYINFGLSSTDMELLDSMKLTREQLCQVFGVPAVLFSTDSMADNNYQNAQRDLITNLIVPLLSTLRDELNRVLAYTENTYIDFDVTALPELQRDFEKQVMALKSADWLTYDEKRIAIGYDPKGDVFDNAYVNSGLVKLQDLGIDLTVQDDTEDMAATGRDPLSDDGK